MYAIFYISKTTGGSIMNRIVVNTKAKIDIVNITRDVEKIVSKENIQSGIITIFTPHTTASIILNENADSDVKTDLIQIFHKLVPANDNYRHREGNSQSHALSSLNSPSLSLIIENGQIMFGTWQDIYFIDFDGPRGQRQIWVQVISK